MKNIFLNDTQIHSNTEDLGFVVYSNYQGFESPDIRLTNYDKPGQHGAVVSNQLYGGRTFQIPGRISGRTFGEYEANRRLFQSLVRIVKDTNAVSQPALLQFETLDGLALQAYVYLKQALQFTNLSPNHCKYLLTLYSPDPNLYAQSKSIYSITLPSTTGIVYPVIYPVSYPAQVGGQQTVVNAGDVNTPLVVTFNGPLTSPFITNLTTDESFDINLTLDAGEQLVVDMAKNNMTLNGLTNALQYFVLTNTWMEAVPGNNVMKIGSALSSDTGNVIAELRSAYFGS